MYVGSESGVGEYVSVPLRGKEGAGQNHNGSTYKASVPGVSVPLRGKEGAGLDLYTLTGEETIMELFPSPCGVRRVRDKGARPAPGWAPFMPVSVPLRGKEGAGRILRGLEDKGERRFRPLAG